MSAALLDEPTTDVVADVSDVQLAQYRRLIDVDGRNVMRLAQSVMRERGGETVTRSDIAIAERAMSRRMAVAS